MPTRQQWASSLLHRLGIPQTPGAIQGLVGWQHAEGGHWNNDARFNPLNTTQDAPGAGNTGSQGNIKVYRSWGQGLDATVQTLKNGRYGNILHALRAGDPGAIADAIGQSPWGTSPSLARSAILGTPAVSGARPIAGTGSGSGGGLASALQGSVTPGSATGTGFDPGSPQDPGLASLLSSQPAPVAAAVPSPPAQRSYLRMSVQSPVVSAPPGPSDGGGLDSLLSSLTAPQEIPSVSTTAPTSTVSGSVAGGSSGSGGYVNPFGSSLKAPGRVDEGVDPTIQGPIRAIGDAKVVNLSHNFYKGQPYLVYQLTSGPKAGHYVYVSELVTPHVKVGDRVKAGDVIATGHGPIETGWAGGAQGSYLPLANRAQGGNYTEGMATGHGASFAALLKRLGANAAR